MLARKFMAALALGLLGVLIGRAFDLSLAPAIFSLVLLYGMVLLGQAVPQWVKRHSDPYSLEALREVHQQKEFEAMDLVAPEDAEGILCPNCLELYSSKLPCCPNCGR
ncbi:MAG: hypothetical protein AMXMBFR81_14410 [Chthonomonas sp.]